MQSKLKRLLGLAVTLFAGFGLPTQAQEVANRTAAPTPGGDQAAIIERATRRAVLNNARAAAAARTKAALAAQGGKVNPKALGVNPAAKNTALAAKGLAPEGAVFTPGPGFQLAQPDYLNGTASNWHYTKRLKKFVDGLPGLGAANANNLGNYIPVAVPVPSTFIDGSDYYEIDLVEYTQQLHSDLAPTKLRGYVQHSSTPWVNGGPASNYLGPVIIAHRDRPVRVKLRNLLPTGTKGDLFIPVDTTMMGAGYGPLGTGALGTQLYTQNRAELHLHGGLNPWISDGTPHQWITPAGENTSYKKGAAFQNVPDMGAGTAGDGIATYYYTNQQSGRFMFYHDHSFALTRLNVYAGEAAGYLIVDPVDDKLINAGILPNNGGGLYNYGIPLVIQDKTFVDTTTLGTVGVSNIDPVTLLPTPATDPTWDKVKYGGDGALWYPHVYMVNQNPADLSGANAMGRWDYGPWFWPPLTAAAGLVHGAEPVPGSTTGAEIPGTPNPSLVPEAFMDTPLVNGTAYPTITVNPQAYRFRILNAANDRFWNLSFFQADGSGTEVAMVPSAPNTAWPATWPTDGRDGGVPDPLTAGPSFIQIGNESGFLPNPVVINPQPISYNYNRRDIVVLNVADKGLFLGPAERADVIVDFSAYAGKTLILYNDAPAPVPAFDSRLDYYTGDPDQRDSGGANTTLAGYGPNTRTIMQFVVAGGTPAAFDLVALNTAFASTSTSNGAFAEAQHPPIVPSHVFNTAYNTTLVEANDPYVRIQDNAIRTFSATENGDRISPSLEPKAIQELFELDYGRMNATLGVELPFTNFNIQTTIPLGYVDPATEILTDGTTQYWKITHNGVDTHPVHFHLFDVQIINRVGWDGAVRFPDANEYGWKETVKMNPLEDIIVAFRPLSPRLPFALPLPSSRRSPNVLAPASAQINVTNPLDGNALTISNAVTDYGWEYVWHCHILGHEENDFMRPMVLNVASTKPAAPSGLTVLLSQPTRADLKWFDNSTDETGFSIQRRVLGTTAFATIATVVPNVRSFSDLTVPTGAKFEYRVSAYNQAGDSAASNIVAIGVPIATVSGTVANSGVPLPGIIVAASDGQALLTDASGNYSLNLRSPFTGAVGPTSPHYAYTPPTYSYTALAANMTAQNFNATPVIIISGRVARNSGAAVAGATVTFSTGQVATTNASGNYTLTVPSPYTGTFSVFATGFYTAPVLRTLTAATLDQPGQNFTATNGVRVSGTISTATAPLPGVRVAFGGAGTVVTNASGVYTYYVYTGYTGTMTPSLTGYAFTPATRNLQNVNNAVTQNFTARVAYAISGHITSNGAPLIGVTVAFSGTGGGTATTDATGFYTFSATAGWTGTLTPTLRGTTFSPASYSVTTALAGPLTRDFITIQTISGRTTRLSNGNNVSGVTITYTGATGFASGTATSGGNGNYSFTVPTGWQGVVKASGGGLTTWTPTFTYGVATPVITNLTDNFSGN